RARHTSSLFPSRRSSDLERWLTVLDVGQGLAAVVRTEHDVLVYDAGPRWSARSDAGRSVVVPYLRAAGVEAIDTLVVSHGDNDQERKSTRLNSSHVKNA